MRYRTTIAPVAALLACLAAAAPALAADVVIYRCTDDDGRQALQNAPCAKGLTQQKVMTAPLPTLPAAPVPSASPRGTAAEGALPPLRGCIDAQGGISIVRSACPAGSKPYSRALQDVPTAPLPGTSGAADPAPQVAPATPGVLDTRTGTPPVPAPAAPLRRLPPPTLFQCGAPDRGSYYSEDYAPKSRCLPLNVTGLDGGAGNGLAQACQMVTEVCAPVPDRQLCAAWVQRRDAAESRLRYAGPDNRGQAADDLDRLRRIVEETTCAAEGALDQRP